MNEKGCKMCLLREMAGADYEKIEKYKEAIKPADRVSEETYESRLSICKSCEMLNAGTCNSCGCYVELRALGKESRCPRKKW
ncbi:MAG: hypothetical protein HUJ70_13505 [Pseudobutyrivibrio sp.]|mgnify:FL=1|nr:hypothetical protein [Pseudobutyrivibrio sp.]